MCCMHDLSIQVAAMLPAEPQIRVVEFVLAQLGRSRFLNLHPRWTRTGKLVELPDMSDETWGALLPENVSVNECTADMFRK